MSTTTKLQLSFLVLSTILLTTLLDIQPQRVSARLAQGFKPPKCKEDIDCKVVLGHCYGGTCSCLVGYVWTTHDSKDATCERVACTDKGNECVVYNAECKGSLCKCPLNYTGGQGSPGVYLEKCRQDIDPQCSSNVDCTSGHFAVSGSMCYKGTCTCKYGFKRDHDVCIKINCTGKSQCGEFGWCDSETHSCLCTTGHVLTDGQMTCGREDIGMTTKLATLKKVTHQANSTLSTTPDLSKVATFVTIICILLIITLAVSLLVYCCRLTLCALLVRLTPSRPTDLQQLEPATNYTKQSQLDVTKTLNSQIVMPASPRSFRMSSTTEASKLKTKQSSIISPVASPKSKAIKGQSSALKINSMQSGRKVSSLIGKSKVSSIKPKSTIKGQV